MKYFISLTVAIFCEKLSNKISLASMVLICMFINACANQPADIREFSISNDNFENVIPILIKAAEKGNSNAEHLIGSIYLNGIYVEQNSGRALFWFEKAALQNNSESERALHAIYIGGYKGVEANTQRAVYMITKAAINGDVLSQAILGKMYLDGHGVEQNYDLAKFWLERSDKQNNDGNAAYELGKMYLHGIGVTKNLGKAKSYFERAKSFGHPDAEEVLKADENSWK